MPYGHLYDPVMSAAATTTTVAATFMFKNEEGETESASGQLVTSDENPNYLIHLVDDFPSQQRGLREFIEGAGEIQRYRLLHARTESGTFTFVNLRLSGYTRHFGAGKLSRRTYRPFLVLEGSAFLHEPELYLTHATIQLWGQDQWAQWSSWTIEDRDSAEDELRVTRHNLPAASVLIDGVRVRIMDASPNPAGRSRRSSTVTLIQESKFKLEFPAPIAVEEFVDKWLAPLQFLVASGTQSAAGVATMWVGNTEWRADDSGESIRDMAAMVSNPTRQLEPGDMKNEAFLHLMREFDYEAQLPIYFAAWKAHRVVLEQYLEWIYRKPESHLTRLTYMAQLVESLARSIEPEQEASDELKAAAERAKSLMQQDDELKRFAGRAKQAVLESRRVSLADRLRSMDVVSGKFVSGVVGRRSWKDDVALVRNSVVHGLESSAFFAENRIPLMVSVDILEMLFEARLLILLGFSTDQVEAMFKRDAQTWDDRDRYITDYIGSFDDFKDYVPKEEVEAEKEEAAGEAPHADSEPQ